MARKGASNSMDDISIGKSAPAWMLTYSDLITQILIFFVLFLTLMAVKAKEGKSVILPLMGGKGVVTKNPEAEKVIPPIVNQQQMLLAKQQILIYVKSKNLNQEVKTRIDERGLIVSFADKTMFQIGSADILPQAKAHLDSVSKILRLLPNEIRVEGYTCDIPIHNAEYASNWDLSLARAANVTKYFVEKTGFSPVRISAAGYGEFKPYAPNDTEEHRRMNRRVDIVILWQKIQPLK